MLLRRRLRLCKSRGGKEKYNYEKFLHEAQDSRRRIVHASSVWEHPASAGACSVRQLAERM
jgi:hypothetical protein